MYTPFNEFQANKRRFEYIELLGKIYPQDRAKFRKYRWDRLRAIYIAAVNNEINNRMSDA